MCTRVIRVLRPSWLLALALAFLVSVAGQVPRAHAQADECLVELEGDGDFEIDDNDEVKCCAPYCTTDGRRCTFRLRTCPNQAATGCEGGDLKKVVAKSKCGGTRGFRLNPGTSSACGAFTNVVVRTKKRGQRQGKCKFSLRVKSKDRPARKDVDRVTLVCDPAPVCSTTTTTTSTTSTTIAGPVCPPGGGCCADLPSLFSFTTTSGGCGTNPPGQVEPRRCVQCATGAGNCTNGTACTTNADCTGGFCLGELTCSGLYFGSGQPAGIGLPGTVPDRGLSYSKVASCTGANPNLTPTTAAEVPTPAGTCSTPTDTPTFGERHCTSPGCSFGAPLSLPNLANPATSTCVINEIAAGTGSGEGTVACATGETELLLPLASQVYLTGSVLGTAPCPRCTGGTAGVCGSGTCQGGTRNQLACTPETGELGAAYPTSHDCPPPNGTFIGTLPIGFNLTTGVQTRTSFATTAQTRVFCGFCFDNDVSTAFANPPDPCSSDADCVARGDAFTQCRQHSNGAFRNVFATTITETGAPAGVSLDDCSPHPATLVSVFCIPPSYDSIVDPSGELPGPGAVSLPGNAQFIP